MGLDLTTDPIALTQQLVDVESVSACSHVRPQSAEDAIPENGEDTVTSR